MKVFFYGLFMDEGLLATKGIKPTNIRTGFVNDYRLHIGERATLLRSSNDRAYGIVMDITASEAVALYSEDSVADYLPEAVTAELKDGTCVEATCYILGAAKVSGTNKAYARKLFALATRLGFPESYTDQIR